MRTAARLHIGHLPGYLVLLVAPMHVSAVSPSDTVCAGQRLALTCCATTVRMDSSLISGAAGASAGCALPIRRVLLAASAQASSTARLRAGIRALTSRGARSPDDGQLKLPRAGDAIGDRQTRRRLARSNRARCSDKGGTGNCLVHDRLCGSPATCQPRVGLLRHGHIALTRPTP